MNAALSLAALRALVAGHRGTIVDVACPVCGPDRFMAANQRRQVLRIWRVDPAFWTYTCARCELRGHTRDPNAAPLDPAAVERARREAEARDRETTKDGLSKALWLWRRRLLVRANTGETYLRDIRAYRGEIPATVGFLAAAGNYPPSIIAAMGVPDEPEPGRLVMRDDAVCGVHVIRLKPNGTKADGEKVKVTIGRCPGSPIVVAPLNDLLGMAVTEGVEDALSVFAATGLGAWAAGGAKRIAALADTIPPYTEVVSLFEDDDSAGHSSARDFLYRLAQRNRDILQREQALRAGDLRDRRHERPISAYVVRLGAERTP